MARAAVLKTAGRNPVQVRVLVPPFFIMPATTRTEALCKQCGKTFWPLVAKRKVGQGLFCNRSCASKYGSHGSRNPNFKNWASKNPIKYVNKFKEKFPDKARVHQQVYYAVKTGKIKRGVCPCGSKKTNAHHEDYSKPFDIIWLCSACHNRLHAERKVRDVSSIG